MIDHLDDPAGMQLARQLGRLGHIVYGISAGDADAEGGFYVVDGERPGEVLDEVWGREGRLDVYLVRGAGIWPHAWGEDIERALSQSDSAMRGWGRKMAIPSDFEPLRSVLLRLGIEA